MLHHINHCITIFLVLRCAGLRTWVPYDSKYLSYRRCSCQKVPTNINQHLASPEGKHPKQPILKATEVSFQHTLKMSACEQTADNFALPAAPLISTSSNGSASTSVNSRHGWGRSAPPKQGFEATSYFNHHASHNKIPSRNDSKVGNEDSRLPLLKSFSPKLPLKISRKGNPRDPLENASVVVIEPAIYEASKIKPVGGLAIEPEIIDFDRLSMIPNSYNDSDNDVSVSTYFQSPAPVVPKHRSPRRAVLVAATYFGSRAIPSLPTNIKYTQALFDLLTRKLGYRKENVVVLTDMPSHLVGISVQRQPTRYNLIDAMKWLVRNSQAGDKLFFAYSGLGTRTCKDKGNPKRLEECLIPTDYPEEPAIPQVRVSGLLMKELHKDATLTAILDCKQAHTIFKLPYLLVAHRESKKTYVVKYTLEYEEGIPAIMHGMTIGSKLLFGRLRRDFVKVRRRATEEDQETLANSLSSKGRAVAFGGCGNFLDISNDSLLRPMPSGTLTWAIVEHISKSHDDKIPITFRSILMAIAPVVSKRRGSQMAQITMSHKMHLDTPALFI